MVFVTEADKSSTYLEAKSIFLLPKAEVRNLLIPKLIWLYYTNKWYLSWNNILQNELGEETTVKTFMLSCITELSSTYVPPTTQEVTFADRN